MREETERARECDEGECKDGLRNRFFKGKAMGAEEFRVEQRYFMERRRLLNRSVVGWGVVHGFSMKFGECTEPRRRAPLYIGAGLALDCHGAEIVNDGVELRPRELVLLEHDADGCVSISTQQTPRAGQEWLLSVHYAERSVERVALPASCGCPRHEYGYVCETRVFSLTPLGKHGCPCGESRCRRCCCEPPDSCGHGRRLPHRCLCHWTVKPMGCGPMPRLRECHEWQGLRFDPNAGVPLACVRVDVYDGDPCDKSAFGKIVDDCGPRRVVKNNELLYDLVRGCGLTHISWISWEGWHGKEIKWTEFEKKFPTPQNDTECATDFVVCFSKPVRIDTLTPDAFVINGVTRERGTAWGDLRRIPVSRIDPRIDPEIEKAQPPECSECPPKTTTQARLVVDWAWFNDEIPPHAKASWFLDQVVVIEIEIRGDQILDCNGVAVDANAHGRAPAPTGNGTPGGTFVSAFKVAAKSAKSEQSRGTQS